MSWWEKVQPQILNVFLWQSSKIPLIFFHVISSKAWSFWVEDLNSVCKTKEQNYNFYLFFFFMLSLNTAPFYFESLQILKLLLQITIKYLYNIRTIHWWLQPHLKVTVCSGNSLDRIFLIQKATLCHVTSAFLQLDQLLFCLVHSPAGLSVLSLNLQGHSSAR